MPLSRRETVKLGLSNPLWSRGFGGDPRPIETTASLKTPLKTGLPLTYVIEYGMDYLGNPDYIRRVAEAPPMVVHVGHDLPFKAAGPRVVLASYGGRYSDRYELLSPAKLRDYTASIRRMVEQVHRAGVPVVIPYICNQTIGGDYEKRGGFWEFYDRWDEYREFGLYPKPAADPIEWLQRDPEGNIHYNYPKAHTGFRPEGYRYAPCPNNEHWTRYLSFVAEQAALCGYDGIFVDNNIVHCYCRYCRQCFGRYLRVRYAPAELNRRFGTPDASRIELHWGADRTYWATKQPEFTQFLVEQLGADELEKRFGIREPKSMQQLNDMGTGFLHGRARAFVKHLQQNRTPAECKSRYGVEDLEVLGLTTPEGRLRWFETQRFWAWSVAENLLAIRRAGEKHKLGFLVAPNWGAIESVANIDDRRLDAKNVKEHARGCVYLMFEEDGMPGRLSTGVFHDYSLEYKFGYASGVRPIVLPYGKESPANVELAYAEAAASGGGAFTQPSYRFPEIRKRYRRFFEQDPELFRGLEPLAHVGLAFLFDQVHLENKEHLRSQYRLKKALGHGHFLFHYLTEADFCVEQLNRYRVVILPHAMYIPDVWVRELRTWVATGGILVLTGDLGSRDDLARVRAAPAFSSWFRGARREGDFEIATIGKGKAAWAKQIASLAPMDKAQEELYELGGQRFAQALEKMPSASVDTAAPLVSLLSRLAPYELRFTTHTGVPGVRANAFWMQQQREARVVMHFLNYDLSADSEPARVRELPVRLRLPRGGIVSQVRNYSPDRHEARAVDFRLDGSYLVFHLPELRIYEVVDIQIKHA